MQMKQKKVAESKNLQWQQSRALRDKAPRATHPLLEEALGGLMERPSLSRVGRRQIGQQHIAGPEQVVPVGDQLSIQIIFPVQMVLVIGGNIGMVRLITCQAEALVTCWSMTQGLGCKCMRLCKISCTFDPCGRTAKHHHHKLFALVCMTTLVITFLGLLMSSWLKQWHTATIYHVYT